MKISGIITNKYTVSALIVLCLLLVDIIVHKGMTRVIIPSSFSSKIQPVTLPPCEAMLLAKEKHWLKAINTIQLMQDIPVNTAGIECDVYFDLQKGIFEVYHDSTAPSLLNLDTLLSYYAGKKMTANIWFDFKNLDEQNRHPSLREISRLKNKYNLHRQIIVESPQAKSLEAFCDSGYFTSYYVPYFNPYRSSEKQVIRFVDSVHKNMQMYPASALSGYYFQYPVLKKYFPNYPILTWVVNDSYSVISAVFKRQLESDESIKVILYPFSK